MKLLFLHHGNILGGAPLSLLYLAREVERASGVAPRLACHAPAMQAFFSESLHMPVEPWQDTLNFFGKYLIGYIPLDSALRYKLFWKEAARFPGSVWRQFFALRRIRPDLVHLNSSVMFSSAIAAWLAGIPIVWHIRETLQGAAWKVKFSSALIRRLARRIICISEIEAARFDAADSQLRVIYNPLNFEALRPQDYDRAAERQKLGLSVADKVVVTLGGVAPRKGALEQIQAMKHTPAHVKLLMAGPPLSATSQDSYHARVRAALAELPPGKVIFTGMVENVAPLLVAADALTFTGMTPHFPRPVFEAWLMEKPVVVFDMEGVSNQVEDGVNGVLVRDLNAAALGAALSALLQDEEAMKRMGAAGRRKSEQKCHPAAVAQQVLSVYREIMDF